MIPISGKTRFCAVIGNPVEHSMSPAIHNAAFRHLGLDFVYVAAPTEDVKGTLAGMRAIKSFRGMSVTIPHKIDVMQYVDEIAEVDRSIGSINTVIHEGDRLIGLGTDGPAAVKALADAGVPLEGRRVLIIGAGGASRAISFALARAAKLAGLTLLDINEQVLKGLVADLQKGTDAPIAGHLSNTETLAAAMGQADVLINCSPIGMHPKVDASPVPAELFREGQAVFDIVYNPLETKLLREARERGLVTIQGVEMFVNQAALQFKHFTGEDPPIDVMRRVVVEHLQS